MRASRSGRVDGAGACSHSGDLVQQPRFCITPPFLPVMTRGWIGYVTGVMGNYPFFLWETSSHTEEHPKGVMRRAHQHLKRSLISCVDYSLVMSASLKMETCYFVQRGEIGRRVKKGKTKEKQRDLKRYTFFSNLCRFMLQHRCLCENVISFRHPRTYATHAINRIRAQWKKFYL